MKISRPVLINVSLAVVIALAITGCIVFLIPKSASGATEATQLTTTVQQGAVSSTITASGSIAARREVAADFDVSGTIKEVDIALGDTVTKGDKIGVLVQGDYNDALADAKEQLADARTSVSEAYSAISDATSDSNSSNEQTASSGEQALSQAEDQLDSAQDQVDSAQDAVDTAQDNVDSTVLYAPISGLVVAMTGTVGGTAGSSSGGASTDSTTSSGFATIADVTKMTMTASIAEADIADVAVGQTADVTFPALTDVNTTATVTAVAPTATASNSVVTYDTTITLDEIPDGLRLGQTAEVTITTVTSADDALYLPTAAITTATDGTSTVDVIGEDGETATATTVELGVVGDEGTEILSGLEEGQTVVLGTVAATDDTETAEQTTGGFGGQGGGTGTFPGGTGGAPAGGGPGQ